MNNIRKPQTKSIGQRLSKTSSYQKQEETLLDWADNWRTDQESTLYKLRLAARNDNHGEIMHMIDQLFGMTEKRFTALNNVIKKVSDPGRKLKDQNNPE